MSAYTDAPFTPPCSRSVQSRFLRSRMLFAASCHWGPVLNFATWPKYSLISWWSPRGCWLGRDRSSTLLVRLLHSSWLSRRGLGVLPVARPPASRTDGVCSGLNVGLSPEPWFHAIGALQEWWSPGKWPLLSLRSSCRPLALNVNSEIVVMLCWHLKIKNSISEIPINMSVML